MMAIAFEQIRAMTFDCYGTLIDWEAGIVAALGPLLKERSGREYHESEILERFGAAEAREESRVYRPYREVLSRVVRALGRGFGARLEPGDDAVLADSMGLWPAFADTPGALARLATRFRLVILSNVDRDLFEATRPHLGPAPVELISAEDVRAYKPKPAHFCEALRRLAMEPGRVCHVAQSLYHDVPTAQALGFRTVWVNRRVGKPGFGATPLARATPDLEVPDLATLAEMTVPRG